MQKVSIVLPVYNGEKYLRESIESVLRQTYQNYELIIVNDASTDHSLEIAEEYAAKDSRICIYTNDHNSKLPQSLNNGFSHATGELYTWTSDDNIMLPDFLKRMVETFQEHPEVDLIYAKQQTIDAEGNVTGVRKYPKDMDDIYIRDIVAGCFMYRKKVHETLGGYDTSKFLVEDYDFFLRAYEQFTFYYLPEVLYSYRDHPGSLTGTRIVDQKRGVIQLLTEILNQTDLSNEDLPQTDLLSQGDPLSQGDLPSRDDHLSQSDPLSQDSSLSRGDLLSQDSSLSQGDPLSQDSSLSQGDLLSQDSSLSQGDPLSQDSSLSQGNLLSQGDLPSQSDHPGNVSPSRADSRCNTRNIAKKRAKLQAGLAYQYFFLSDYYFKQLKKSQLGKPGKSDIGNDWLKLMPHRIKVIVKELFQK